VIENKVIVKLDHKNLNLDVDFMRGKMASTEVLAIAIWEELESDINQLGATLHLVKVQETENNFVEYFGK
jgi:6-pyruvoyltetrahydropterin/6-carboxytetrahydropterin synthase